MNQPKKHHFLPQFYLDGFQVRNGMIGKIPQIYVFEKHKDEKCFVCSIKDAGCKTDYNTIEDSDGKKDRNAVEQELSRIEGLQANLITKVVAGQKIEPSDINDIAFFVLLMRNRVPSIKNFIEKLLKKVLQSTANMLLKRGDFPSPPKEIKKLIDRGENPFEFEIFNHMILNYMFKMATDELALELLSKMNYSLVKAQNGSFITSDAPVALYVPNYTAREPYGVGLVDKEVEITLPITEEYLLLISWQKREVFYYANAEQIAEYNRRTIIMAQNYMYAATNKKEIFDLIQKFRGFNAGIDVFSDNFDGGSLHISRFIPVTAISEEDMTREGDTFLNA